MRTLAIIAVAVITAHPAIAQPRNLTVSCTSETVRQAARNATLDAQHRMFDACRESGAEEGFCKRVALAPDIEQIRAECEADGEDPDVCEQSAELPGRESPMETP